MRYLPLLGLLGWLFGCDKNTTTPSPSPNRQYSIDLIQFRCNETTLGEAPKPNEHYKDSFDFEGVFRDDPKGIEIGLKDGTLDYVYLDLRKYPGDLTAENQKLSIGTDSTVEDIIKLFGEPYWKDEDEKEIILFYEDAGRVELQFEFPQKTKLGIITLMFLNLPAKLSGIITNHTQ